MAAFAGKNSRITYNSVNMLATRWTLTFKLDEIDVTNFESPTYSFNSRTYAINQFLGGFLDWEFTADAFWDYAAGVFFNPPDVFPGQMSFNVVLYPDKTATAPADLITFTDPFVNNVVAQTDVRGAVSYNFSMKNGSLSTSTITIGANN